MAWATPGGRVGDASPLGKGSKRHLDDYVRAVAHALMRKRGMSKSHAIAVAQNSLHKWASGRGKVRPQVRAAAAAHSANQRRIYASLSNPLGGSGDGPRVTMGGVATRTRGKRRAGSIPAGRGKGAFPIRNQRDIRAAASLLHKTNIPRAAVVAHVRREARKRGLKLTPAFKGSTRSLAQEAQALGISERQAQQLAGAFFQADLATRVYHFKHGWIPIDSVGRARKSRGSKSRVGVGVSAGRSKDALPARARAAAPATPGAPFSPGDKVSFYSGKRMTRTTGTVKSVRSNGGSTHQLVVTHDQHSGDAAARFYSGKTETVNSHDHQVTKVGGESAVQKAERTGRVGNADPAELAKRRTDTELRRISTNMGMNTAEGRAAQRELWRRQRVSAAASAESTRAGDNPARAALRARVLDEYSQRGESAPGGVHQPAGAPGSPNEQYPFAGHTLQRVPIKTVNMDHRYHVYQGGGQYHVVDTKQSNAQRAIVVKRFQGKPNAAKHANDLNGVTGGRSRAGAAAPKASDYVAKTPAGLQPSSGTELRRGQPRYDGTPTLEVHHNGQHIGTVYKGETRTHITGRTNISQGVSVRKGYFARHGSESPTHHRTREEAVRQLKAVHEARNAQTAKLNSYSTAELEKLANGGGPQAAIAREILSRRKSPGGGS